MTKIKRRGAQGQGLVEYALTLVLVSLVGMVIIFALGMAITRVYALVAGTLGVQINDPNAHTSSTDSINIEQADCDVNDSSHTYQIVVSINTSPSIGLNDVSVSTPNGFLSGITGDPLSGYSLMTTSAPGGASNCPTTVVAQGKHATSIKPITVVHF